MSPKITEMVIKVFKIIISDVTIMLLQNDDKRENLSLVSITSL